LENIADVQKSQTEHTRTTCGKIQKQRDRPVLKFMHLRRVLKGLQVKLSERGKQENMKKRGRRAGGGIRGRGMIKCCSSQRVCFHFGSTPYLRGDRCSTVVKVLCYKSEGHWFDPN